VKPAIFHPAARAAIRLFPREVRREIGRAIFDLQKGEVLMMPLSRPMNSVDTRASEIRIRNRSGSYRVFYYRQSFRGILIFHAFMKKTQATPQRELNLARRRLKELLHEKV
jgi:phage-related protein